MQAAEALVRYTIAKERAQLLVREIEQLIEQLKKVGGMIASLHFGNVTATEAQILLKELRYSLTIAVGEANLYADDCGEPKLGGVMPGGA